MVDSVGRVSNRMANHPRVIVYFKIIASRLALVPKEVDFIVLVLNELEAEALVPAFREDIKGYLASYGVLKFEVSEFIL